MEQSSNQLREAYVEFTNNGTVVTFYYDTLRDTREGETSETFIKCGGGYTEVCKDNRSIELVVFDASFKEYSPWSTSFMFCGCTNLKAIQGLENLNTDKVEKMYSMFNGCASLRSLDLSHFKTARVREMQYMFSGCRSLTSLNLSSFNTARVTNMQSMFSDCSSLVTLDLTSFNTSSVKRMDELFFNCSALTTIYSNFEWQCESADDMFSDCVKLKGAVPYNMMKDGGDMANPETGYFTYKTEETESSAETTQVPVGGISTAPQQESALEGCSWFTLQGTPLEGRFEDLPAGMYIVKKN